MTNEFVYGEILHMSNFMWRVWTIMRQLANYAVGILFLYHIFKTIVSGKGISELKNVLFSVLKASILINISRFAIASMIDLSVVATAAVGSMPAQVLNTQWNGIAKTFYVPSKFTIKRDSSTSYGYDFLTGDTLKEFKLEDILPQADNVSGPLFFIGVSVFQLFDTIHVPQEITSWSTMTLDSFLSLFVILLFTIPLIILAIVNMMRIFCLWIWIMLSPIVALDRSFDLKLSGNTESETAKKLFEPSELIALIFLPVVTVASL